MDLDRVIIECVSIIYNQCPRKTSYSEYQVLPLLLTRFARGGKTNTLAGVFDKLKSDGRVKPFLYHSMVVESNHFNVGMVSLLFNPSCD